MPYCQPPCCGSSHLPLTRMGWTFSMAFMPYGQWWRRHRKAFNQHFHQNAVQKYRPIQQREVRLLLQQLRHAPEDFMHSSRQ